MKCDPPQRLALRENIAVALPVVGTGSDAQEVSFIVAANFRATEFPFRQQRHTSRTAAEVGLRDFGERVAGVRNAGERRVVVCAERAATGHCFRREESPRRYAYALV